MKLITCTNFWDLSAPAEKLATGVAEFETYIRNNQESIPNYGERYRQGETISTAFVESTINQSEWSEGASADFTACDDLSLRSRTSGTAHRFDSRMGVSGSGGKRSPCASWGMTVHQMRRVVRELMRFVGARLLIIEGEPTLNANAANRDRISFISDSYARSV